MISSDLAVSRELQNFELMQIWTFDPKIGPLYKEHVARMKKQFGTTAIPLHVVLDTDGSELGRFIYNGTAGPEDYAKFLENGMRKFKKRQARRASKK